jgi:hypothetical protein
MEKIENKLPLWAKLLIEFAVWAALNALAALFTGHLELGLVIGALVRALAHLVHPLLEHGWKCPACKKPTRLREGLHIATVALVAGIVFDGAYHLTA